MSREQSLFAVVVPLHLLLYLLYLVVVLTFSLKFQFLTCNTLIMLVIYNLFAQNINISANFWVNHLIQPLLC